jgi:hypothetical protein
MKMKKYTALLGLLLGPAAHAAPLLTFGQVSSGDTVTATVNASNTQTTVLATNVPVTVTGYVGGGAPFAATFNMDLTSSGPIQSIGGILTQDFGGTASWMGAGMGYLSATFMDTLFAISGSSALAISASQPPGTVAFTSSVLPASDFTDPLALSFSFADVTPPAMALGTTLEPFVATISGTSSVGGTPMPEPLTLGLFGMGALGVYVAKRWI